MIFRAALVGLFLSATLSGSAAQVRVQSIDGAAVDALAAPSGTKAIVFLFTSTDCPISNRYAPEVRRIVSTFARQGVVFRLVYPNPSEQAAAIREHMTAFGYDGSFEALRDPALALVSTSRRPSPLKPPWLRAVASPTSAASTIATWISGSSGRRRRRTIWPMR